MIKFLSACFGTQPTNRLDGLATPGFFKGLPNELTLQFLTYLSCRELLNVDRVCRDFHKAARDNAVWNRIVDQHKWSPVGAAIVSPNSDSRDLFSRRVRAERGAIQALKPELSRLRAMDPAAPAATPPYVGAYQQLRGIIGRRQEAAIHSLYPPGVTAGLAYARLYELGSVIEASLRELDDPIEKIGANLRDARIGIPLRCRDSTLDS
jgi:hypothetical protein